MIEPIPFVNVTCSRTLMVVPVAIIRVPSLSFVVSSCYSVFLATGVHLLVLLVVIILLPPTFERICLIRAQFQHFTTFFMGFYRRWRRLADDFFAVGYGCIGSVLSVYVFVLIKELCGTTNWVSTTTWVVLLDNIYWDCSEGATCRVEVR